MTDTSVSSISPHLQFHGQIQRFIAILLPPRLNQRGNFFQGKSLHIHFTCENQPAAYPGLDILEVLQI